MVPLSGWFSGMPSRVAASLSAVTVSAASKAAITASSGTNSGGVPASGFGLGLDLPALLAEHVLDRLVVRVSLGNPMAVVTGDEPRTVPHFAQLLGEGGEIHALGLGLRGGSGALRRGGSRSSSRLHAPSPSSSSSATTPTSAERE